MSFNVTGMEAYVKQNAKEIASKAVTGAKTVKLLLDNKAVQFGKGTEAVNTMSQSVTFSDGTACGRVEDAAVSFSQRKITFTPLKNQKSFCFKELYQTVLAEAISKGQSQEELDGAVYGAVAENRAALIAYEIEKLVWKGDKTLLTNMKWIDGYLKLITEDGTAITPTGSDVIAKLQSLVSQVDVEVKEQEDFRVFIGKDTADALKLALYNKNMFNPGAENVIPGTDIKYEVVSGLNGSAKAVATRISNLRAILDEAGEETNAVMKYDELNDKAIMDFHFGIGVQVVFPDQAYHASI